MVKNRLKLTYFPGCSLATSARENNSSLLHFFDRTGVDLIEIKDWNCCGSSSAHSIDSALAEKLPARNLSLVEAGQSLMVACPSCYLRLKQCQLKLRKDAALHASFEKQFGRAIDLEMEILHFFEVLDRFELIGNKLSTSGGLRELRCAPYYGCMLALPPELKHEKNHFGLMEGILSKLASEPVRWSYTSRCCGTYLSVVRPDIATKLVNQIVSNSIMCHADCIVTACAMCHLNLEIRCSLNSPIPILHFSELLSLASSDVPKNGWFERHLIDPRPLLKRKGII